jgi:hypothetical protein
MKPLKKKPWIGTRKGKGGKRDLGIRGEQDLGIRGEGDLDIHGEGLSTMRH